MRLCVLLGWPAFAAGRLRRDKRVDLRDLRDLWAILGASAVLCLCDSATLRWISRFRFSRPNLGTETETGTGTDLGGNACALDIYVL